MVSFKVYFHVKILIGLVGTEWASVPTVSTVKATVFSKRAAILSSEWTLRTSIRSFSSVRANVFFEVVRVTTDMSTDGTSKSQHLPIICLKY